MTAPSWWHRHAARRSVMRMTCCVAIGLAMLASGCGGAATDEVDLAREAVEDTAAAPADADTDVDPGKASDGASDTAPGAETGPVDGGSARGLPSTGGSGGGSTAARGAPSSGGSGTAKGAPIRIPSIVQDQGRPLATVKAEITASVLEQCGGSMCLTLVVQESDPSFQTCQFVETVPRQETVVERDTVVVIVAGTLPCEAGEEEGGEQPGNGESGGSATEAPDGGVGSTTETQPTATATAEAAQ